MVDNNTGKEFGRRLWQKLFSGARCFDMLDIGVGGRFYKHTCKENGLFVACCIIAREDRNLLW